MMDGTILEAEEGVVVGGVLPFKTPQVTILNITGS